MKTIPRSAEEKSRVFELVGSLVICLLIYALCTSFATPMDPARKRFIDEATLRGVSAFDAAELWDREERKRR